MIRVCLNSQINALCHEMMDPLEPSKKEWKHNQCGHDTLMKILMTNRSSICSNTVLTVPPFCQTSPDILKAFKELETTKKTSPQWRDGPLGLWNVKLSPCLVDTVAQERFGDPANAKFPNYQTTYWPKAVLWETAILWISLFFWIVWISLHLPAEVACFQDSLPGNELRYQERYCKRCWG